MTETAVCLWDRLPQRLMWKPPTPYASQWHWVRFVNVLQWRIKEKWGKPGLEKNRKILRLESFDLETMMFATDVLAVPQPARPSHEEVNMEGEWAAKLRKVDVENQSVLWCKKCENLWWRGFCGSEAAENYTYKFVKIVSDENLNL